MIDKKKRDDLFLTLPNILLMVFSAVLIVLADKVIRFPADVQGEGGLFAVAVMLVAVGFIRHAGTATLISLFAGIVSALIDPGQWGFLYTVGTMTVVGVGIDLALWIMGGERQVVIWVIAGCIGNLLHFIAKWLHNIVAGVPASLVPDAIPTSALQHLVFGLIGGLMAFVVFAIIQRMTSRATSA